MENENNGSAGLVAIAVSIMLTGIIAAMIIAHGMTRSAAIDANMSAKEYTAWIDAVME